MTLSPCEALGPASEALKRGKVHLQSPGGAGGALTPPALRPRPRGDVTRCECISQLRTRLLRNETLPIGPGLKRCSACSPSLEAGIREPGVFSPASVCVQTSAFVGASALPDLGVTRLGWPSGAAGTKPLLPLCLPASPSRAPRLWHQYVLLSLVCF